MMSEETAMETKYCSNCKKDIAAANFTMHEVHCRRHLVLCDHCKEPVPRSELEQHFNDVHAKVACTQCAMELEKDHVDDHMKHDCPKRQVSCEYCELEMAHSDLASHIEFCGTRTEACPRCGNFIMHKDLTQHNTSNCTYPETKPPASNTNGFQNHGGGDDFRFPASHGAFGEIFGGPFRGLHGSLNPFEFEELRRVLEGDADGRGMPSAVAEDSDASAAAEGSRLRRGGGFGVWRNPAVPRQKKNNTQGGARKATTNRRSEVNRQREQASSPTIPPHIDYDTMLAMQLAAEDDAFLAVDPDPDPDPDAHLNQLISNFEKRSHQQVQRHTPMEQEDVSIPASPPPSYNKFAAADEDMIPCEFCGESFPAFALVHHQSVCDPLASGLWGQGLDVPPAAGRNNEALFGGQCSPVASRRPVIPVINNLGSASPAQEQEEELNHHLTDNGDHLFSSLENIMLPCEFCNELLPADSLVQHQAMCEGNPQLTPRVMTPAAAQPSSAVLSTADSIFRDQFFPTSFTNRRRQADPTEDLWATINQRGPGNEPGTTRQKKRPNVPRAANPSERKTDTSVSAARPGASRSQQTRGGSNRVPDEVEPDFFLQNLRGSRQGQGRTDSASRIRHTLDSLLSTEGVDSELTGEGARFGRRPQGSRKRTSNRGGPSTTTGVSSRTVMQNLQEDRRHRPQARNEDRPEGGVDLPGRRLSQRERGDHLFNSPGNTRNPASQNRPRRSSNSQVPPEWS